MTTAEVTRIIALLKGAYPRQEITRETIEAYSMLLSDLEYQAAALAVQRHCRLNKWFPTIAEIRHAALKEAGTGSPLAGDAWAEAVDAARRHGYRDGNPPEFSHPAVTRAVRATGWKDICHCPDDELQWVRKHFLACYEDFRTDEDAKSLTAPNVSPERRLGGDRRQALPERAGEAGEFVPQEEAQSFLAGLVDVFRGKRAS